MNIALLVTRLWLAGLFWNPSCGFCQRMLEVLKGWDVHPPKGVPRLLVVSTATLEANQALGLRSTIVLDQNMSVGSKFCKY